MNKPLHNLNILVTRASHQAQPLCDQINALGGTAIVFPTLAICPSNPNPTLLQQLDQYDLAIFISPNAVSQTKLLLQQYKIEWPAKLKTIAIGVSTATALRTHQLDASYCPTHEFNSEGVLALPILQQIKGKKIILLQGDGGRELLATTLRARQADVTEAVVYKRIKPTPNPNFSLPEQNIDIIICTSNAGLENLVEIVGLSNRTWLQNMSLLVVSERMAAKAKALGFVKPPLVADNATDIAIIQALIIGRRNKNGTNKI